MSLEDDFCDIIKKSRLGQERSVSDVAKEAGLPLQDLEALEKGSRQPISEEVESLGVTLHLKAPSLYEVSLEGWVPQVPTIGTTQEGPVITVLGDIGGYEVKGYLLFDPQTRDAVMIDTAYNAPQMISIVKERGLRLKAICLTHGHADHAGGLDTILKEWPVPVYLGDGDFPLLPWKPSKEQLSLPAHNQCLPVGSLGVQFVATPGHTPGGFCYQVQGAEQDVCFVGDTIFAGSIGRSNPFASYQTHLQSVREQVLELPESTVLFPGHGPATTVKEERISNPFG
ncbi:MAG: MBL fold metallo-hydrolase [Nitrospirae bacterium]|nr:MBL fold metallo-hydrolase [Nitrospirota bacterium]